MSQQQTLLHISDHTTPCPQSRDTSYLCQATSPVNSPIAHIFAIIKMNLTASTRSFRTHAYPGLQQASLVSPIPPPREYIPPDFHHDRNLFASSTFPARTRSRRKTSRQFCGNRHLRSAILSHRTLCYPPPSTLVSSLHDSNGQGDDDPDLLHEPGSKMISGKAEGQQQRHRVS
ncbi:hypothetical protein BCR44DRAFT_59439 [Catenaria anguillulae PL171]|uniref:Uncharacterized protein n=1 Tax=Catenaria anguillulae PL171 TaxID=765915 RepID=A0A1Y2HZ92_9FUNG|nr:hypothetical protein BCR44DRAFT_59439 [Catenaria anguillulae PL171]